MITLLRSSCGKRWTRRTMAESAEPLGLSATAQRPGEEWTHFSIALSDRAPTGSARPDVRYMVAFERDEAIRLQQWLTRVLSERAPT